MSQAANTDFYTMRRVRTGKTKRDHQSGAHSRRLSNGQTRAAYVQWCASSESKDSRTEQAVAKFPAHICRGNGTSSNRRPERRPGKAT